MVVTHQLVNHLLSQTSNECDKILKSKQKGFTMIEILIVIITVAVFGSITTLMLANASKIYSTSLKRQKLITESRSTF